VKSEIQKLQGFLQHAWSRRWWLLGVQVLAAAAAVAAFNVSPPKYRSQTTIRVSPESVINPLTKGLAVSGRMEDLAVTLKEIIHSRKHIEKVIDRLGLEGLERDPVAHENLISSIRDDVSIEIRGGSRTDQNLFFRISYIGLDPYEVRDVTNTLASIFIERSLEMRKSESNVAYDFIREQLVVYREKLEESENALRRFEEEHLDDMPETRAANLVRLDALKSSLDNVRRNIRQARTQKELLIGKIPGESTVDSDGAAVAPNPLIQTLRAREGELSVLRRRYSENYPDIVALKAEIASMKEVIEQSPTVPVSAVRTATLSPVQESLIGQLQRIDIEIESLVSRVPQLEEEIRRYEGKVRSIPEQEQMLAQFRRDYDVDNSIYEMFLRRLEEARVSRELEMTKKGDVFRVLDAAVLPVIPYSPDRNMFFLYGLAAGLALNLALTFLFWSNDTSFKSVSEAEEYLGIGVIAMIPRLTSPKERSKSRRRSIVFIGACGTAAAFYFAWFFWNKVLNLLEVALSLGRGNL